MRRVYESHCRQNVSNIPKKLSNEQQKCFELTSNLQSIIIVVINQINPFQVEYADRIEEQQVYKQLSPDGSKIVTFRIRAYILEYSETSLQIDPFHRNSKRTTFPLQEIVIVLKNCILQLSFLKMRVKLERQLKIKKNCVQILKKHRFGCHGDKRSPWDG